MGKFIGKENVILARRDLNNKIKKIATPYLKGELMRKNVDISILENIKN
jgi:hypothetical protein